MSPAAAGGMAAAGLFGGSGDSPRLPPFVVVWGCGSFRFPFVLHWGMPAAPISLETRLQMASLIAAVRTARHDAKDFQGMSTPRTMAALAESLWIANKLCERAAALHPEWFER